MNTRRKLFFFGKRDGAPVPSFDPDYQAILDVAIAEEFTLPSAPVQNLQNNLLVGLKSTGKFFRDDCFLSFIHDGAPEFSRINWVNPTGKKALLVSAPLFTPNQGFTGDGSSSYIDSRFIPSTDGVNYKLNDAHAALYVRENVGASNSGRTLGDDDRMLRMRVNESSDSSINRFSSDIGGQLTSNFGSSPTGLLSLHRESVSQASSFANKIKADFTYDSGGLPTKPIHILKSVSSYSTNQVSFASLGDAQDDINDDVVDLIDTYVNAIGAL